MKKTAFLFALILIIYSRQILAQNTYEFLRVDNSARSGALAGSYISNNDDADVIFYNPSGIGLLTERPVSFSFVKHLLDINLASLSYSQEFEGIGRFGAGIKYINYGNFTEANEFGAKTGEFGAGEFAFLIGYSNILYENFYYGANAKVIYSSIADRSSSAMAVDLGLHYAIPNSNWNFGFAALNLGGQISSYYNTKEKLPIDVAVGVSKKLAYLPLKLSVDFHKLNEDRDDFVSRLKAFTVGAEFTLSKVMKLRFGYDNEKRTELKIGSTAGIAGFNVGLGAKISSYQFDYGYSSLGLIGALHRISISTTL